MQWKLNLTWVIYLPIEKTTEAKPYRVNLRSPFPRIYYYHNKRFISKGILIPYTNLQLNIYPNTQLDLFYSDNLSFSMYGSQYVTNQSMHRSKYVTNYQLEKNVGCKVHQFINTMKIMKLLDYKTLWHTNTATFSRERWTRAYVSGHNMTVKIFCIKLHKLWRLLK